MKKQIKRFALSLSVMIIILGTVSFAAEVQQQIKVVFNKVNVAVNGKKVNADNILYNGTTYVPLRAVAEILGKEVGWDEKTNTASINDKATKAGAITIDQVPYKINILEPNSIGTVYMQATYNNNTNYPITSVSMTVLLKDSNKKTYLMNHDTVMPGETSPIFESFGPSTQKHEDYEILTITIRAQNTNDKTITVEYDTKLKKYDYREY